MSKKLSCLQAYRVMLRCFDNIYFQTYDDDVSFLVSNAALYSASSDPLIQPETMDPAVWYDWMDGVYKVTGDPSLKFNEIEMTVLQAYQAAGQYFMIHCDIGLFQNIGILRNLLRNDVAYPELSEWIYQKWNQALDIVLHESLPKKIGHFLGESTSFSEREAFLVMQFYMNKVCQKKRNHHLIKLLQHSRILNYHTNYWQEKPDIFDPIIWQFWIQALEIVLSNEQNKILNLMMAYKATAQFLLLYDQHNNCSDFYFLIKQFDNNIDKLDNPMVDDNWLEFMNAVVEVNAQQTEVVYNLVSINTPISVDKAQEIIIVWFKKYELNLELVKYFKQALEIVKKNKRSYLILDNEITVLEAYHVMLQIVEKANQIYSNQNFNAFLQQNAIEQQNGKPIDFIQMLEWIWCAELVCQ